ncbi:OLC1v1003683C1 [Oldenlandia corymbosa var. corymbosa]|uniref:OLC1v1003683C1 n=1 Tax=Oldenlandia corymbosa var. corymbosa TaxID=529605 RepID=A0AAV1DDY7_OLDCO|nr:OLC1v1003683C1 [Oldenlandia corymbosa var. corymbosa]
MASPQQTSSGSDVDPRYAKFDEKKRKRMISNRESARRSRVRKQQHVDELVSQVNQLEKVNKLALEDINNTTQLYLGIASENNVLRAQAAELTDRLRSLNNVLEAVSIINGVPVDIPEIPENLLEPWQLPCPVPPVMASANWFQ